MLRRMTMKKSLRQNTDRYIPIITAMLRDVQNRHVAVYTPRDLEVDGEILRLLSLDGMEFLTKELPALGKVLDKALTEQIQMSDVLKYPERMFTIPTEKFWPHLLERTNLLTKSNDARPLLFWPLFARVFDHMGTVLPNPDVECVVTLRQLCFTFYKLKLPYSTQEEQKVIDQFVKTEREILPYNRMFCDLADMLDVNLTSMPFEGAEDPIRQLEKAYSSVQPKEYRDVIRGARRLLARVFQRFDPRAIVPKHGPGAVSTGEKLQNKYRFSRINPRIDEVYPFSEYFLASSGHLVDEAAKAFGLKKSNFGTGDEIPVLDTYDATDVPTLLNELKDGHYTRAFIPLVSEDNPTEIEYRKVRLTGERSAKVILVPKDSRGPRLISCEPLENQWVQQGLSAAIVRQVESHPLTRDKVYFTDQEPNRQAALIGSIAGRYATLDLKEASDRVTVGLVRLLFPAELVEPLLACRSMSTMLPNKQVLNLEKYAPMGSALCFPVMALSIWALLTARFHDDAHAKFSMLVYGDDVIVPGYQAQNAIKTLEAFGLLVNQDKSCFSGFFRESCGMDAFRGHPVTPVRVRTLWTHRPSPKAYLSYIEYSNAFRRAGFINVSEEITKWLCDLYREVPSKDMMLNVPSLDEVPEAHRPKKSRTNKRLQKREWFVYSLKAQVIKRPIAGWDMLLRYFSETSSIAKAPGLWLSDYLNDKPRRSGMEALNCVDYMIAPFSVRSYTPRDSVVLEKSWR